jgi:transcriptional regulator with XRE-family HTH domain
MDMRKLVGRNVRRLRMERQMTQEQFAERSGFSQQYISDLERGRRNPTIVSLYELAQALGATPVDSISPDARPIPLR